MQEPCGEGLAMTVSEEMVEQAKPVQPIDASETKDRRRARSVVSEALRKAGSPLDNRGLSGFVLPGLWNASINILIALLEKDDVVALLADRFRGIVGHGDNADSPARQIPEKEAAGYRKQVSEAGTTIMECLEPALVRLEQEGLDDRFPETVFDASLTVLLRAWGPDHVRRAIGEQSALFLRGVYEPLNFMEPLNFLQPTPQKAPPPPETQAAAKSQEGPSRPVPAVSRRQAAERRVEAWVSADMSAEGIGAWAASMKVYGDTVSEERFLFGTHPDTNGRANWLKALHECVLAICADVLKAKARIEVSQEFVVRAVDNLPGSRIESEEPVWTDIDAAMSVHDISVVLGTNGFSNPEVERCDRKIQFLMEDA